MAAVFSVFRRQGRPVTISEPLSLLANVINRLINVHVSCPGAERKGAEGELGKSGCLRGR